jgi:hypothetical protein
VLARKAASRTPHQRPDNTQEIVMQRPLTMRTSDRSDIDHERPRQRDRYKRKKHRPPESDAEEDKHSRDRQAQHHDFQEKLVSSLNNSKDVQFEIPGHRSRVAATSPQTDPLIRARIISLQTRSSVSGNRKYRNAHRVLLICKGRASLRWGRPL